MNKYDVVIGLEVHVQVKTESKMFCSCPNKFAEEPNTLICPICMGYPGAMPVPNKLAIEKTIVAGLMCGCEISNFSKFDRKSYFYPDMAKNYQISQYDLPFCKSGAIKIFGKGFSGKDLPDKSIGITRIHLEEDAAKSIHFNGCSGIDYNKGGVPLMEIVSEPDISTPDEAYAYLVKIKEIMQYGNISDCEMEKGQLRCDVNVSLKVKGAKEFGTKVELKNLNSFSAVHSSLIYEIDRQAEMLDNNKIIIQETRGWNDDAGETYLMRTKESAHDYRYFPEPDIPPIAFTDEYILSVKNSLPELPAIKRERFVKQYLITSYDADVLTSDKDIAHFFELGASKTEFPKILANWIISELLREISQREITILNSPVTPTMLAEMVNMIGSSKINGKIAKTVFSEMFDTGKTAPVIVKEKGLGQVSDSGEIEKYVEEVIRENPLQVQQYKDGKTAVIQFFVGNVMKLSKGKANPQIVVKYLKEKLD